MATRYGLFLRVTLPLAAMNFLNQAARTVMAIIGPVLAAAGGGDPRGYSAALMLSVAVQLFVAARLAG